jgi:hypothetical protein
MASDNTPNTFTITRVGSGPNLGQVNYTCANTGNDGCPDPPNWGGQD